MACCWGACQCPSLYLSLSIYLSQVGGQVVLVFVVMLLSVMSVSVKCWR